MRLCPIYINLHDCSKFYIKEKRINNWKMRCLDLLVIPKWLVALILKIKK